MEAERFDEVVRTLATSASRRASLAGFVGGVLAAILPGVELDAARRTNRKHESGAVRRKGSHAHVEGKKGGKKKKRKRKKKGSRGTTGGGPGGGGGGGGTPPPDPIDQATFDACLEPLATLINDQIYTACPSVCQVLTDPECAACVENAFLAFEDDLVACTQAAVAASGAQQVSRRVAAAGTPRLGTCHGSKYKIDMEIAARDMGKPIRDALLATLSASYGATAGNWTVPVIIAIMQSVSALDGVRVAAAKLEDVERKVGCKAFGIAGQCVVENPGPYSNQNDGNCCPLNGPAAACGKTCCFSERCERCVGGKCEACLDSQYCRKATFRPRPTDPPEYAYICRPCPPCNPDLCEARSDTPPEAAPGSAPCATRFCLDGPCPQGQTCVGGECRPCPRPRNAEGELGVEACCLPKTCTELGKVCGSHSDGCGGNVDCGTCGTGKTCTIHGCCDDDRACPQPGGGLPVCCGNKIDGTPTICHPDGSGRCCAPEGTHCWEGDRCCSGNLCPWYRYDSYYNRRYGRCDHCRACEQ